MLNNPDVLYTQGSAAVWSAVEINIGILCNCLAMLKPFVRRHLPWLRSIVGRSTGANSSGRVKGISVGDGYVKDPSLQGGNKRKTFQASDGSVPVGTSSVMEYEMFAYEHGDPTVIGGKNDSQDNNFVVVQRKEVMVQDGIMVTTTVAMGRTSDGDVSTDDILRDGMERLDFGHAV